MTDMLYTLNGHLSDEDIVGVEQRLGRAIPSDYRAFLLQSSGGKPDPSGFWIPNKTGAGYYDWSRIVVFFGIGIGGADDLEDEYTSYSSEGRLPPGYFPIADDLGGSLICISTQDHEQGAVYYWSHKYETYPATHANMYYLASSFQEFFNSLTDDVGDADDDTP